MAYPSVTYTFVNGNTADASQVNTNFSDLISGLSDGTKDISISAATIGGALTANGAISLNNAVTINDAGADVDMRVEGDTEQNLIFVDASADRIGIGTSAPQDRLHVSGGASQFSGTAAATAYATRADHIIFARTDLQTTYRHKITGMHTATPSINGLMFEIAAGASTYVTMLSVLQRCVGLNTTAPTSMLQITDNYPGKTDDYTSVLFSATNTSSTASKKKIGCSIQSTGTWDGTSATNTGLVVNVSGGTTNYAATFSGGNVGIGTTTPANILDVSGTGTLGSAYQFRATNATTALAIGANSTAAEIQSQGGVPLYLNYGGNQTVVNANLTSDGDFLCKGDTDANLLFVDASADKVGIGTAPTSKLHVYGASGSQSIALYADSIANTEYASFYVSANTSSAQRSTELGIYKHSGLTNSASFLRLCTDDNVGMYLWVDNSDVFRYSQTASNIGTTGGDVLGAQTSDERLKSNIRNMDYGLQHVMKMLPIKFEFSDETQIGFGAQTIKEIIPECVHHHNDKYTMSYWMLIPVLTKAIQEQQKQIEYLINRLDKLSV